MDEGRYPHVPIRRYEVYIVLLLVVIVFALVVHNDPSSVAAPTPQVQQQVQQPAQGF